VGQLGLSPAGSEFPHARRPHARTAAAAGAAGPTAIPPVDHRLAPLRR